MYRSKIEDCIDELEAFIDNCKTAPFSSSKLIVEREQIEAIINDLKNCLPKEIEYCRGVMARSEEIEKDAKLRAEKLVQDVQDKTYELLSENEINQQAIKRSNQIIAEAQSQGQQIYDKYVKEGTEYRDSAQRYLNDMLVNLHEMIYSCVKETERNTTKFLDSLNKVGATVDDNLSELNGVEPVSSSISGEEMLPENDDLSLDMDM